MPPGSINPTNTTTLISNLNPEETADLLLKFGACRKNLAYPQRQHQERASTANISL